MKNIITISAMLLCTATANAQFTAGSGGMHIKNGATVVIDRLLLQPTTDVSLQNNTLQVSSTPVPGTPNGSIARVYEWDNAITTQGTLGIYVVVPAELNGNNFNMLQLAYNPNGMPGNYTVSLGSLTNSVTGLVYETMPATIWQHLTAVTGGTALPIHLLSFTGAKENNTSLLQWVIAGEKAMDSYWVQRSANGSTFETIGKVKAACNGCGIETGYTFTDRQPFAGYNYYRLQMHEIDGKKSFSQTIKIHFDGNHPPGWTISPNPAADAVTIGGLTTDNVYELYLLSAEGRQLYRSRFVATENGYRIDTRLLAQGIYIIRLQDSNGEISSKKLVKQ